jgi:hypothetical protein
MFSKSRVEFETKIERPLPPGSSSLRRAAIIALAGLPLDIGDGLVRRSIKG